jgi:lysophospholipase L1-like esterase
MSLRAARAILTTLFYAALLLGSLEACARVDDYLSYGAPLLGNSSIEDLKTVDGTGMHGRPRARFEKWRMNSLGLQGPEVPRKKAPGHFRVLVLGASESFGLYESPGMSYPAQLERLLARRIDRPVEVLNGALWGMSLPRVTQFCESHLSELDPDVVVYYPTPTGYLDEEPPSAARAPAPGRKERPALRLLRRGQTALQGLLPKGAQERLRERELARAARGKPASWFFHRVPEERLGLFRTDLSALVQCVRRSNARLVLATHANRFRPPLAPSEKSYLVLWRKFYPRADEDALLGMEEKANGVIRRVAQAEGVAAADVAAAVPPEPRNFHDFAHFSDRGAGLAAAALADAIAPPAR